MWKVFLRLVLGNIMVNFLLFMWYKLFVGWWMCFWKILVMWIKYVLLLLCLCWLLICLKWFMLIMMRDNGVCLCLLCCFLECRCLLKCWWLCVFVSGFIVFNFFNFWFILDNLCNVIFSFNVCFCILYFRLFW